MKVSIFPETWGDVIVNLLPTGTNGQDGSGATLCIVDASGDVKDFGVVIEIEGASTPGGYAALGRPIIASGLGVERENERAKCPEI